MIFVRHSVITFCELVFRLLRHLDLASSIHFVTQLCKTLNFLELEGVYEKRVKLCLDDSSDSSGSSTVFSL